MLPEIVRAAAKNFGDKTAIECENGISLSYKDLDRISDEVSGGLLKRGLMEGSIVLLSLPTSIEYLIIYIAASKIGVITAGVNPRFKALERRAICEITEPDLVITTLDLSDGIPTDLSVEMIEITENSQKLLLDLRSDSFQPKELEENLHRDQLAFLKVPYSQTRNSLQYKKWIQKAFGGPVATWFPVRLLHTWEV